MDTAQLTSTRLNSKTSTTTGYFVGFIFLGMATAALGPTLSDLAENTGTGFSQISYLFAARSLGYLLGANQVGRLYDRLPGHLIMGAGLLGMGAMLFFTPLIPILWLLVLAMLLLGLGESMLDVGGNTLLVWLHGDKVGPFMNALHFFFGLGAAISPLIIAQAVAQTGDITWAYWTLALCTLPVLVWLLRLPSPVIRREAETSGEARRVNQRLVLLFAAFFFLYVGAEGGFGGWITSYTKALNITTDLMARYLTSVFWGALTVGRLLTIPIAAKVRPRTILAAALAGCLLSVAVIIVWPTSLTAIWVGTLGMGLANAPIFPLTISLAERRLQLTGQITGRFFVGASLGGMSVPWLIGQFFDRIGPGVTMAIISFDLLLAVAIFVALLVYSKPVQSS